MLRKIALLFFSMIISTPLWAETTPITTIHFATEATYPPFEYVDETGAIRGFDIDIAKALCSELKAQCDFSNQAFDSLIPSLKLGKFDAIISAISMTPEREKQVAFTQSYYEPSGCLVAAVENHYTAKDLAGKTIGVQTGTTFEKYLADKYPEQVHLKTYATVQDALLDLLAGRIDMVMADTPIIEAWLKQNAADQSYAIVGEPIQDATYFGVGYGIAVRRDNPELLAALNRGLKAIKKNGAYAKIVKQYFE